MSADGGISVFFQSNRGRFIWPARHAVNLAHKAQPNGPDTQVKHGDWPGGPDESDSHEKSGKASH